VEALPHRAKRLDCVAFRGAFRTAKQTPTTRALPQSQAVLKSPPFKRFATSAAFPFARPF
jgi:hypothetical protein